MSLELLELLCSTPPSSPPSVRQLEALSVLADTWAQALRPEGVALLEQLQGATVTPERCRHLGLEPHGLGDVRAFALHSLPDLSGLVAQFAERADALSAYRALSWLHTSPAGTCLHPQVAELVLGLLQAVERRELTVTRTPNSPEVHGTGFTLGNGWVLDVFVRGYAFWRVDRVIDPEGFVLELIDHHDGPLAELNEYEPPVDVEAQVYGLGP